MAFVDFAELPQAELDELTAAVTEVDVRAADTVVTVDDYGTAVYFIEEGAAQVLDDHGGPALGERAPLRGVPTG